MLKFIRRTDLTVKLKQRQNEVLKLMKEENITTLFSKDSKGKLRKWEIKSEGDTYYQRAGLDQEGAKITEWVGVKCKGKNLGKSSQTTAEQQAISEAENKIKCKLKEGYYHTREEAVNDTTFTPMLAEKYEDYKSKLTFPQYGNPKLDGARCNIYIKNGEIVCRTRSNRDYVSVPHLVEQFKPVLEKHPTWVIDGELYSTQYRDNFEDLMSIIRQSKPTKEDLKKSAEAIDLFVYDVFNTEFKDEENRNRIAYLEELEDDFGCVVVPYTLIEKAEDIQPYLDKCLEEGYEGAMLRNPRGVYKVNGRSKDLLKVKVFQDEEFKIIAVLEGNGAWKDCAKMVTLDLGNGKTCDASLKGTQDKLQKVLLNKKDYIGVSSTVIFFGYTNHGLLRFPVIKELNRKEL